MVKKTKNLNENKSKKNKLKSVNKLKIEKKTIINYAIGVFLALVIFGGALIMSNNEKNVAVFDTSMGIIKIKLYDDMPITTDNFKKLVNEGFYDGLIFHRVISNFMIQGGCPEGTGMGGPGYNVDDEFVKGHSNTKGTIAMANTGQPNSGGSQFFINLVNNSYLDWDNERSPSAHPVFGEVIEGMDVVEKIGKVEVDAMDKPKTQVTINKITLE